MKLFIQLIAVTLILSSCLIECQVTGQTATVETITTTGPVDECAFTHQNGTCEECLNSEKCFYCITDSSCRPLKFNGIFPSGCKASEARWFSCSLNVEALMIAIACIGIVVVLIMMCCICYCCNKTCKAISDKSYSRVEKRIRKQRNDMRRKYEEKKMERSSRNDAMRAKYGLTPPTYANLNEKN